MRGWILRRITRAEGVVRSPLSVVRSPLSVGCGWVNVRAGFDGCGWDHVAGCTWVVLNGQRRTEN